MHVVFGLVMRASAVGHDQDTAKGWSAHPDHFARPARAVAGVLCFWGPVAEVVNTAMRPLRRERGPTVAHRRLFGDARPNEP